MTIRTGWRCTWLASLAGVLLYGAWPAPEPAARGNGAVRGDNYFAFVQPTAFAPATAVAALDSAAPPPAASDPALAAMPTRLAALEAKVRQLRQQGADEQAVYRLRVSTLPADMADQLAQRELAESDWRRRVQDYRARRDQLATDTGASLDAEASAATASALAQLRASLFAPDEQVRLDASLPPAQPQLRQD